MEKRRVWAAAAALGAVCAWVLAPALLLGTTPGDLGALESMRAEGWRGALGFCSAARYFRPLAAPLFVLNRALFGTEPGPMRLLMLALHLAAAAGLGRLAAALSRRAEAGLLAGFLYAAAPLHWETLCGADNVAQSASHALLWWGLWLRARGGSERASTVLGAAALLFKEDAVVYLPLSPLADALQGRGWRRATLAAAGLGAGYLALRAAPWPGTGEGALLASVQAPSLAAVLAWGGAHLSWAAPAALAAGAFARDRRLWLFGAAAALAGLAPYLPFKDGLAPPDAHRWALCWGGCAMAGGAAALLPRPAARAAWAAAAAFALLSARGLRRGDLADPLYSRMESIHRLRPTMAAVRERLFPLLKEGDAVEVVGFDDGEDAAYFIGVMSPVRVRLTRRPPDWRVSKEPGGVRIERVPGTGPPRL